MSSRAKVQEYKAKMYAKVVTLHNLARKAPPFKDDGAGSSSSTTASILTNDEDKLIAKKMSYYMEFLSKQNLVSADPNQLCLPKDAAKASIIRDQGIALFNQKKYLLAMESFNEGLCWAPAGSNIMGVLYGMRSLVYFRTAFYEFCLENIELAQANNYPPSHMYKLVDRKQKCTSMMTSHQSKPDSKIAYKPDIRQFSYPWKSPGVINELEVAEDNEYGRHVVTKRDLTPGNIIALEEPFARALYPTAVYANCYHCTSNNFYNLKPSDRSTNVMFCSVECENAAFNSYHQFEYTVIDGLFEWIESLTSVRTALRAFVTMKEDVVKIVNSKGDEKQCDYIFDTEQEQQEQLRRYYKLATNEKKMNEDELLRWYAVSAFSLYLLKNFTDFGATLENPDDEKLFQVLLFRCFLIDAINAFTIPDTFQRSVSDISRYDMPSKGSAVFLFLSNFNHSCAPSVGQFHADSHGKFGIVVVRPIKKDQQVFISYGIRYDINPNLLERKQSLHRYYHFDCTCEACEENYVGVEKLKTHELSPKLITSLGGNCCKFDVATNALAETVYAKIAEFLTIHSDKYPCLMLSQLEEFIFDAIHILTFKKPLEMIFAP